MNISITYRCRKQMAGVLIVSSQEDLCNFLKGFGDTQDRVYIVVHAKMNFEITKILREMPL